MNMHKRQMDSEPFGIKGMKVWVWCYWSENILYARMVQSHLLSFIPVRKMNVWGEEVPI